MLESLPGPEENEHANFRARQLEHGWHLSHFNFFFLHQKQDTGSCRRACFSRLASDSKASEERFMLNWKGLMEMDGKNDLGGVDDAKESPDSADPPPHFLNSVANQPLFS